MAAATKCATPALTTTADNTASPAGRDFTQPTVTARVNVRTGTLCMLVLEYAKNALLIAAVALDRLRISAWLVEITVMYLTVVPVRRSVLLERTNILGSV